jgi:hypothetical protein
MAQMTIMTPMCDTHEDVVAETLCLNHRRLMCVTCGLKEAKLSECEVLDIRHLGKQDSLLLRSLLLKQSVSKKERQIDEHAEKAAEMKKVLEQNVLDTYNKLIDRIQELKSNSLALLDKQANVILQTNKGKKQPLLTFQKEIDIYIKKISIESLNDPNDLERELNEIEKKILETLNIKETLLESSCNPNAELENSIMQSDKFLSYVSLLDQEHYDVIPDTPQKEPIYSDEVRDDHDAKVAQISDDSRQDMPVQTESRKSTTSVQKGQSDKGYFGIPKFLQKAKKTKSTASEKDVKSKNAEIADEPQNEYELYEYSADKSGLNAYKTGVRPKSTDPKSFINKTVQVSELKREHFSSALKFSKLLYLGEGCIGLMSEINNSVTIVGLDGHYFDKTTLKGGKISMCGLDKGGIATVKDNGLQIDKYKVSNNKMTLAGSIVADEQFCNITGFDFDDCSSNFAVSTPEKVIILDKSGKTVKAKTYNAAIGQNKNELVTIFNFKKDCLYILNTCDNSLKMFSFRKKCVKWKRKLENTGMAKNMCLYNDKLCITCGSDIAIISATSGDQIGKPETNCLLEDCLGLCVIDNVLVFSSGSDNFETSTKLAYTCM